MGDEEIGGGGATALPGATIGVSPGPFLKYFEKFSKSEGMIV
jgi:hypothetical protein